MKVLRSEGLFQRRCVWAATFAALVLGFEFSRPARAYDSQSIEQRIAQEIVLIHDGERNGLERLEMGRLWAKLASDYEDKAEFKKAEDAYNRALRLLESSSPQKADYAAVLDNLGSLYSMMGNPGASEQCRKRALALLEKRGDKLAIAQGKSHLAGAHLAMRRFKEARREALEAYNEMVALKDPDIGNLVSALFTLSYAGCGQHGCADALEYARRGWSLASGAFPADSLQVGMAHLALGFAEWRAEIKDGPDEEMRKGIEIVKMRTPQGHPYVLHALEQYRTYLAAVHREPEATEIALQETQLEGARQPGCANCTVNVYGLRGR
jgi:tetratricopeptide (TPR) repeat protein